MAEKPITGFADATGACTIPFQMSQAGLQWVVMQMSVETIPFSAGGTVTIRKNGRYVTSTQQGSNATAAGLPYVLLSQNDQMTAVWSGLTVGAECILTLFYNEFLYGEVPDSYQVV